MSTINNSMLNLNVPLTAEQVAANADLESEQVLQQEDFFALLSQQLAYQDPFEPVDNSEMISQMASFTTAEGITALGTGFSGLQDVLTSSQSLQASTLVGQKVLIPQNEGYLADTGNLEGAINSKTGAYNATVTIENGAGAVIRTIHIGDIGSGNARFSWDGLDANGQRADKGTYIMKANGTVNGSGEELTVASYAHVESVSLGGGTAGVHLNLQGLGGIKLSEAIEVAGN
ncbi:MAG: flagellar hook assembly protein FlgD [Psychromonas sp.]